MATGAEARAFAIGQPATGAHRANAMLAASLEQVCAAMAEVLRDPALEERGGVGGSLGANARAAPVTIAATPWASRARPFACGGCCGRPRFALMACCRSRAECALKLALKLS